jgi:hypothetical protein
MHLLLSQAEYPALYGSPKNSKVCGALILGSIPLCEPSWSGFDAHEHSQTTGKSINRLFIIIVLSPTNPNPAPLSPHFFLAQTHPMITGFFIGRQFWNKSAAILLHFPEIRKNFSGACCKNILQ